MTRDQVLDVLELYAPLRRRRIDRAQVPVHFMQNRIAVVLPYERFPVDQQTLLDGKFQNTMTRRFGQHAYLDFVHDWRGLETPLTAGLT